MREWYLRILVAAGGVVRHANGLAWGYSETPLPHQRRDGIIPFPKSTGCNFNAAFDRMLCDFAARSAAPFVLSGDVAAAADSSRPSGSGAPAVGSSQGATPMHFAAYHGSSDAVHMFLESDADPDVVEQRFDDTPLGWAVHGHGPRGAYPSVTSGRAIARLLEAGARLRRTCASTASFRPHQGRDGRQRRGRPSRIRRRTRAGAAIRVDLASVVSIFSSSAAANPPSIFFSGSRNDWLAANATWRTCVSPSSNNRPNSVRDSPGVAASLCRNTCPVWPSPTAASSMATASGAVCRCRAASQRAAGEHPAACRPGGNRS